jgi:hypothetical protein
MAKYLGVQAVGWRIMFGEDWWDRVGDTVFEAST